MSAAAQLTTRDDVANAEYRKAPESKTPLSLRVPVSMKRKIEVLVKLWKAQATARKEDPTNIDNTHVATELLGDMLAVAFDQFGGYPADEAAVDKLEQQILSGGVSSKKK